MRLIDADALRVDVLEHWLNEEVYCANEVIDLIDEQPTINPWHRVEEPPKKTGRYVVWCGVNWYGEGMHEEVMIGHYSKTRDAWTIECQKGLGGPLIGDVTHWMPIESPKEE